MRMASAPSRRFSTAELAAEFGLSRHHLAKIMQKLAAGGIVTTMRGAGGGATLARDPADINLGQVVRILEAQTPLVECFAAGGGDCTVSGLCRLRTRLRAAKTAFLADLDRSTLADVALMPLASTTGAAL